MLWPGKSARGQPRRADYSGRTCRVCGGGVGGGGGGSGLLFRAVEKTDSLVQRKSISPFPDSFPCPSWTTTIQLQLICATICYEITGAEQKREKSFLMLKVLQYVGKNDGLSARQA